MDILEASRVENARDWDILEAARAFRFQSDWERRFHEYDLLVIAGIDPDEAERIARRAAADRAHKPPMLRVIR